MLALDRAAAMLRAMRIASSMLALMGFVAATVVVGQALHTPLRHETLGGVLIIAVVVLLVIAPLSWFAINAIRPVLLLPIAGLALWPVIAYYQYVERAGGAFGPDILYGTVIPNIPIGFVLWAGLRGMLLSPSERVVTRVLDRRTGYLTLLRFVFGVWPGLRRSPV